MLQALAQFEEFPPVHFARFVVGGCGRLARSWVSPRSCLDRVEWKRIGAKMLPFVSCLVFCLVSLNLHFPSKNMASGVETILFPVLFPFVSPFPRYRVSFGKRSSCLASQRIITTILDEPAGRHACLASLLTCPLDKFISAAMSLALVSPSSTHFRKTWSVDSFFQDMRACGSSLALRKCHSSGGHSCSVALRFLTNRQTNFAPFEPRRHRWPPSTASPKMPHPRGATCRASDRCGRRGR